MKLSPGHAFSYRAASGKWVRGVVACRYTTGGREGYIADVQLPEWVELRGRRMWVSVEDVYPPF